MSTWTEFLPDQLSRGSHMLFFKVERCFFTVTETEMEKLRRAVNEIAFSRNREKLSPFQRSLVPLLSFSSSLYKLALSLRLLIYRFRLFRPHRLPVPVISIGNLSWGGNGKTPMVEFIASWLADSGIPPLILTRGYAGGDEAKMLQRHLASGPTKIGVGADRAATAACFFEKYGYMDPCIPWLGRAFLEYKEGSNLNSEKIGVAILDDGMQHWRLWRDLEIVMVNGLMPWGNRQLIPRGPLREPLTALSRADVAVVHHANLVLEQNLKDIELVMQEVKESLPVFFTRMAPSYFFKVGNINSEIPLGAVCNSVLLCISGIGSANAFVQSVEKIGALYVDRLDFSDHHMFTAKDVDIIRVRLGELEERFGSRPIVVVTEKDYDRDPDILKCLHPFEVLALCSKLQIIPRKGRTEEGFKKLLTCLLEERIAQKL